MAIIPLSTYDAETLRLHRLNVEEKQAALAAAIAGRDDFIRAALSLGSSPAEIGRIAGLTRGRVHQIRDRAPR